MITANNGHMLAFDDLSELPHSKASGRLQGRTSPRASAMSPMSRRFVVMLERYWQLVSQEAAPVSRSKEHTPFSARCA
jgi:hypothetical protein